MPDERRIVLEVEFSVTAYLLFLVLAVMLGISIGSASRDICRAIREDKPPVVAVGEATR